MLLDRPQPADLMKDQMLAPASTMKTTKAGGTCQLTPNCTPPDDAKPKKKILKEDRDRLWPQRRDTQTVSTRNSVNTNRRLKREWHSADND